MKKTLLFLLAIFASINLFAQSGEIRGFVYEQETSEPAIYTSVYLKGTTFGSQTNLDGFFSISRIPPGKYVLMITSLGYDTIKQDIEVKSGDLISRKLYLKKAAIDIKEVEVSAENEAKKTETQVSINKITPKEIKQIPTVGGEPDLAQYLQVLPGVIFSGDQGGQLYIRGGTAVMNKLLLDGMIIYNPFHSIGLYSVLDADIIRGADVYTGGYNSEHGGRISSIMDITTRDGNKRRFGGKAGVNPFTAKLILEGPLKKETDGAEGSSSFLLSARTSYLDRTSKTFYQYADSNGLPFAFTDMYGKISMSSQTGSKVNFFGFNFTDQVKYAGVADLSWSSAGGGTNFVLVPTGSSILIDGNFAYSNYQINLTEADGRERFSKISGFNTGFNFSSFMGKNEVKYGFEFLGFRTDYNFTTVIGQSSGQRENTTEIAGYVKYKYAGRKLVIEPGMRLHYYASLSEASFEPRFGLKYNIAERFRFKAAGGFYSQNLLAAASDRDVVNLFYGYLSGADNVPDEFRGEEVTSRLQKARHIIAGFEVDLPGHMSVNIEGYIKDFTQLQNINRNKIYEDNQQNSSKPDSLVKDFIIETGLAKGVDFTLKYDHHNLYVWVVYSLTYVTRQDENRTYFPNFDRRHNVNFVASYKMGAKKQWQINARWNLGSPFPFSQPSGYFETFQFSNGIGTNVNSQNGTVGIYYDDVNTGRLSYFHRLDLSIMRTFNFSKNTTMEVSAGATNLYNRDNIFYVRRLNTDQRVFQLPIIPTLGVTMSF